MLVAFARNQTMVTRKQTGASVIHTDPQPLGDSNYCEATLNVPVIFGTLLALPGSVTLTVDAEGSNDGTNWFPVSAISLARTSTGTSEDGDYVTCAFVRFKLTLETTYTDNNDLGVATFDLHANLTRK